MNTTTTASRHAAPGQYLGYALQPVRLCYHLLASPEGASVSLEHLDDIAVHHADGTIELEQAKSALSQNPLTNWAPDLWKSVSNWLDAIDAGEVGVDSTAFRLYVVPSKRVGKIAQGLSNASNEEEVGAVVRDVCTTLKKLSTPPACMQYVQKFLDASNADRSALITNMSIVAVDDDPVEPVRGKLRIAVPRNLLDLTCKGVIGLAAVHADGLIRAGQTALIDADKFREQVTAFVARNNLPDFLDSFSEQPEAADVDSILKTRPIFVRQLELIDADDRTQLDAVSAFLRSSADKSNWAESGQVFEQDLVDWDENLLRRGRAIQTEISDLHGTTSEKARGRTAYSRSIVLDAPMSGRAVPGHFVCGCFNALADAERVGWHPRYAELLHGGD